MLVLIAMIPLLPSTYGVSRAPFLIPSYFTVITSNLTKFMLIADDTSVFFNPKDIVTVGLQALVSAILCQLLV